jgi:hypothetical protein
LSLAAEWSGREFTSSGLRRRVAWLDLSDVSKERSAVFLKELRSLTRSVACWVMSAGRWISAFRHDIASASSGLLLSS